jgi:hypothetical protein
MNMDDRLKTKVVYNKTIYEVFSYCDKYVNLCDTDEDGDHIKIFRKECILLTSTGIRDSNGVLIYEGDILKNVEGVKNVYSKDWYTNPLITISNITYCNRKKCFVCGITSSLQYLVSDWSITTVIGNVYTDNNFYNNFEK